MLSAYRRPAVVVALLVAAGLAGVAVRPGSRALALPMVESALTRGGWRVLRHEAPVSYTGSIYQVSTLVNARGYQAQLYLASVSAQKMIHWSGELGFEGDGYQTLRRDTTVVSLGGGSRVPVGVAVEQRLADRELVEYAVVDPDGTFAHSDDDLLGMAWGVVRGKDGPFYLVRVATPAPSPSDDLAARARATSLLAPLLSTLRGATATGHG